MIFRMDRSLVHFFGEKASLPVNLRKEPRMHLISSNLTLR